MQSIIIIIKALLIGLTQKLCNPDFKTVIHNAKYWCMRQTVWDNIYKSWFVIHIYEYYSVVLWHFFLYATHCISVAALSGMSEWMHNEHLCNRAVCVWMTKSCYFNRYSKWTRQYIFYVWEGLRRTPQAVEHVWAWLLSNSQEKKKKRAKISHHKKCI